MGEVLRQFEPNDNFEGYKSEKENFLKEYSFELENSVGQEDETEKIKYVNRSKEFVDEKEGGIDSKILESPNGLNQYFEDNGFKSIKPISIVKKDGTTLYVSSGVQILDLVIHEESDIPENKIFIAQPVVRTQFIDSVKDNVSTSFINLSTESVNGDANDHFNSVIKWFSFMKLLGISSGEITVIEKSTSQRWGKRKFDNLVLKFLYKGLEIGDAIYIPAMPQDTRSPISISDIGFGIERLNSVVNDVLYFNAIVKDDPEMINLSKKILDYIRTLTLICSSGVEPSNSDHGYRFRLFAKRIVPEILGLGIDVSKLVTFFFNEWNKWCNLQTDVDHTISIIGKELDRNLNRLILDEVNKTHRLIGIEINRSTEQFWTALRNSGVSEDEVSLLKNKYNI
ncbi:MAG: hypothetical protein WCP15_00285 [bacterium]